MNRIAMPIGNALTVLFLMLATGVINPALAFENVIEPDEQSLSMQYELSLNQVEYFNLNGQRVVVERSSLHRIGSDPDVTFTFDDGYAVVTGNHNGSRTMCFYDKNGSMILQANITAQGAGTRQQIDTFYGGWSANAVYDSTEKMLSTDLQAGTTSVFMEGPVPEANTYIEPLSSVEYDAWDNDESEISFNPQVNEVMIVTDGEEIHHIQSTAGVTLGSLDRALAAFEGVNSDSGDLGTKSVVHWIRCLFGCAAAVVGPIAGALPVALSPPALAIYAVVALLVVIDCFVTEIVCDAGEDCIFDYFASKIIKEAIPAVCLERDRIHV